MVDTNVFVSHLLVPGSPPSRAILKVEAEGRFLFSDVTMADLAAVLARSKFDVYIDRSLRDRFLASVIGISERIVVEYTVTVCRDPKDNRLLEVAADGKPPSSSRAIATCSFSRNSRACRS